MDCNQHNHVNCPSSSSSVPLWCLDVILYKILLFQVSGSAVDLEEDLSTELDIVGRINPDTVWDYIGKMKKASNKDIVILRLQAANDEEKMQYIALYSYLSSRNRFVFCGYLCLIKINILDIPQPDTYEFLFPFLLSRSYSIIKINNF